jgi:hypothetical protein
MLQGMNPIPVPSQCRACAGILGEKGYGVGCSFSFRRRCSNKSPVTVTVSKEPLAVAGFGICHHVGVIKTMPQIQ